MDPPPFAQLHENAPLSTSFLLLQIDISDATVE